MAPRRSRPGSSVDRTHFRWRPVCGRAPPLIDRLPLGHPSPSGRLLRARDCPSGSVCHAAAKRPGAVADRAGRNPSDRRAPRFRLPADSLLSVVLLAFAAPPVDFPWARRGPSRRPSVFADDEDDRRPMGVALVLVGVRATSFLFHSRLRWLRYRPTPPAFAEASPPCLHLYRQNPLKGGPIGCCTF